jgi:hypothetical protein
MKVLSGRKVWKKDTGTGEEITYLKVILRVLTGLSCIVLLTGQFS